MESTGSELREVYFTQDLDIHTGHLLRDLIRPHIASGVHIHLDLGAVSFIDSSGIEILIRLLHDVRAADGKFEITRVSDQITRVLRVTGLYRELGIDLSV